MTNLATLKSGDLVEVELEIDSKNDYEYLIFEDLKAAGFEPIEVRSGYNGNDMGAYVELRDETVGFFARTLARGKHSVRYRLRAEIPGKFSALPATPPACTPPSSAPIPTRRRSSSRIRPRGVERGTTMLHNLTIGHLDPTMMAVAAGLAQAEVSSLGHPG